MQWEGGNPPYPKRNGQIMSNWRQRPKWNCERVLSGHQGGREREELSNTSNTLPILRSPPIRQPRRAKPNGSHEFLVPFPGSNLQSREFIFRASGTKHNQFDLFLFTCFAARRSIRRSRRSHRSRLRETERFSTDSASLYPIPFLAI